MDEEGTTGSGTDTIILVSTCIPWPAQGLVSGSIANISVQVDRDTVHMYVHVCTCMHICVHMYICTGKWLCVHKGHIQKDCIINSLLNEVQNVAEIFTAVVRTDWVYTLQTCTC